MKRFRVIPAKAGIQRRISMRRMSHAARRRSPLDPRFHGDDNGCFYVLLAFILVILSSPALATPTLDPNFCQALVKHVPDADVAYRPGVDVNGKPVVPADLPGSNDFQIQKPVTIPLTADLLSFLNLPTASFPFNTMGRTDIQLGTLTVDGDKVLYNGQPLTDEQQDNLAVLCMKTSASNSR